TEAPKESRPVDKNKEKEKVGKDEPGKKPIAPGKKVVKKAAKRSKRVRRKKKREVMSPEMVATAKGYTGRRISLDFKDADIQNILRLIAEVSRLNIVAGSDVKGKVSLRLVNVPWDQVLEIVLKTNNLGMIRDGNVLRIAPLQKIAKEKAQILADKKAEEQLEDLIVRLISVNYATAGNLQDKVKALLSERGSVSVDSRTNVLIVKDTRVGVEEAEILVKNLDTPTPQVLIEARIVEASTTFARDLGIEWGIDTAAIANNAQMDLFGNLTSSGLTTPSGQSGTKNFAVSLPASGSAGPLGAMGFTFGKLGGSSLTLDLRLSAGEVGGLSKIVSRPRIVTLDNKQAKISQGKTIPYQTVADGSVQTQFFDATLDLTVTPHIAPDGSVMLKIKASKNSKGEDTAAGPVILKKEASTEILLKDGETTVIGGIVESTESDSASGVPLFKDIPVLGWLFKRQSIANDQTELLIFITPTILKGEGALSN
ncbi:MAG: type IV pilus secretin PilQ, partial [Thermodesulfobacteriota bacterium]